DAFADAFRVLDSLSATEESRMSGGLFVLALRACADRAERGRALADKPATSSACEGGARLADLLGRCVRDPLSPGGVPATRAADSATWRAEWSRLYGQNDPTEWAAAAHAWTDLGRPHRA